MLRARNVNNNTFPLSLFSCYSRVSWFLHKMNPIGLWRIEPLVSWELLFHPFFAGGWHECQRSHSDLAQILAEHVAEISDRFVGRRYFASPSADRQPHRLAAGSLDRLGMPARPAASGSDVPGIARRFCRASHQRNEQDRSAQGVWNQGSISGVVQQ